MEIALPQRFVEMMQQQLGAERAERLFDALDNTATPVSLRLNPLKFTEFEGTEQLPWSRYGRYLNERPSFTLDGVFHGGGYYVQEASSQFVGHILESLGDWSGSRVLDMCAAPGGKSTLYSTLVGRNGIVVANEVDRRRVQVLSDNIRKWGAGNCVVTIGDGAKFEKLESWFDVVAVDAPCSGEGMFRKMEHAREEWSEANVKVCCERQIAILRSGWSALRSGGVLIYSTCTFNNLEDEGVLRQFCEEYGDEIAEVQTINVDSEWGVECGKVGCFQTFRFLPSAVRGEGFFVAVAAKDDSINNRVRTPKGSRKIFSSLDKDSLREVARWVEEPHEMTFASIGDSCYGFWKERFDDVKLLAEAMNVVYSGVEMGQIFKKRLKPGGALALFSGLNRECVANVELHDEELLRYLRGQDFDFSELSEGVNLVTTRGVAVGFAKRIGNRVNNMYPKELRIQKM